MFTVDTDITIDRPIDEVYAVLADPNRIPEWATGALEVKHVSGAPGQEGAIYAQTGRFLGRPVQLSYKVTGAEPGKRLAIQTVSGPIPIKFEYRFRPVGESTEVHATAEGEASNFFKLAEPLLATAARRQMVTEFGNLKDLLESGVLVPASA